MTNPKSDKKFSVKKNIFMSISLSLSICFGAAFLLWYLPLDPESPPSTELGEEPEFDALFENSKWLFLFVENNRIIESDIYGKNERVVLDIVNVTHNDSSELLYDFSISPNGKYLAVNYYNERDTDEFWHPPLGKVLIVEIRSGNVIDIPTTLEGYKFQWGRPAYWLSPSVFLVSMHRFLGNNSSTEDVVFLRYDLQNLTNTQVIEIDHCGITEVTKSDPNVLLLTSNCRPHNQIVVWALDVNGKRVANSEEKSFYEKCQEEWWWGESCTRNLLTASIASIKVENVTDNMVDGFGRWYDNNWYRDYIYLNDKIVRVTDTGVEVDPFWDADIKMFIWGEVNKTFQMDINGRFRFWHDGDYLGKISKSQ
jgi:hypothetical protein